MYKAAFNKLKAYTIIEVTVAMIITSISIAITYTAFNIIHQSYREFNQKNGLVAELLLADRLFTGDFSEAISINRKENGMSVRRDSGVVNYSFTPGYILRNQYNLRTDTLFITTSDLVMRFEQRPSEDSDKVDHLRMEVRMNGELIPLTYSKTYSSKDLYTPDAKAN